MLGHRKLNTEDYLTILKRRRWLILVPMILLPIIGYGITFFIPAEYVSQTLVLIQEQKIDNKIVEPVVSTSLDSRLSSMREQILSRSRLEPIIKNYNLYPSQRYTLDDRIDLMRKAIAINPIHSEINRTGGLPGFFITFNASNARTAQQVCAEITSLFVNASLKLSQDAAVGTTEFLKGQLEDAKRNLDEQDQKIKEFQSKNGGSLPDQATPNVSMMNSLNTQLQATTQEVARMQQDRAFQESMLAQQPQSAPSVGPTGITVAQASAEQEELQKLLALEADLTAHYTASYPDVIRVRRQITDLRKKIAQTPQTNAVATPSSPLIVRNADTEGVQRLRAQIRSSEIGIAAKQKEQQQLQSQIGMYQARIQAGPAVEEQYKDLTRDYETAQKFYDDLLSKMNQAQMAASLDRQQQGEQFTLMDAANLPDSPTFPKRWIFILAGLFAGLAFGLALTALLEYKDTALRTEQDVWAFTQLPTLAVIAYAGELEHSGQKPGKLAFLRRLFKRKQPSETLTKAPV